MGTGLRDHAQDLQDRCLLPLISESGRVRLYVRPDYRDRGSADITMTMVYAHLAPDHLKAAVERLDFSDGHCMDTSAVQDAS